MQQGNYQWTTMDDGDTLSDLSQWINTARWLGKTIELGRIVVEDGTIKLIFNNKVIIPNTTLPDDTKEEWNGIPIPAKYVHGDITLKGEVLGEFMKDILP